MNDLLLDKVTNDLRTLLLKDMAKNLEDGLQRAAENGLGHLQFLSEMLDIQLAARKKRSLQRRIDHAVFPPGMSFDNFDWGFQPELNVEHLKNLQELGFVRKKSPLLILGKSGTGNYRKFLFMEKNKDTCLFWPKFTFISFHNTSQ